MSAPTVAEPAKASRTRAQAGHVPGEAGIWIFILGDMAVFAVLFATFLVYRSKEVALFDSSQLHLNSTFGLINTLLGAMVVAAVVLAVWLDPFLALVLLGLAIVVAGLAIAVLAIAARLSTCQPPPVPPPPSSGTGGLTSGPGDRTGTGRATAPD